MTNSIDQQPFPLTPTLSRGERENRFPIWNLPTDSGFSQEGRGSSLSRGERARVRGNKTLQNPACEMRLPVQGYGWVLNPRKMFGKVFERFAN